MKIIPNCWILTVKVGNRKKGVAIWQPENLELTCCADAESLFESKGWGNIRNTKGLKVQYSEQVTKEKCWDDMSISSKIYKDQC